MLQKPEAEALEIEARASSPEACGSPGPFSPWTPYLAGAWSPPQGGWESLTPRGLTAGEGEGEDDENGDAEKEAEGGKDEGPRPDLVLMARSPATA